MQRYSDSEVLTVFFKSETSCSRLFQRIAEAPTPYHVPAMGVFAKHLFKLVVSRHRMLV